MLVYSELQILSSKTSTPVTAGAIPAPRRRTTAAIPIPVISDTSGAVRRALIRLFVRLLATVTITVAVSTFPALSGTAGRTVDITPARTVVIIIARRSVVFTTALSQLPPSTVLAEMLSQLRNSANHCVQLPTQPPSPGLSLSQLIASTTKLGRSTTPASALICLHRARVSSADPAGNTVQHPAQPSRALVTKPVKDGAQVRICAPELRQVHMGGDQVRKRGRRPTGRPRTTAFQRAQQVQELELGAEHRR